MIQCFVHRARALQTVVQLMGEREMFDFWSDTYKVHHVEWTQEKAALVLETWQRRFSEVMSSTLYMFTLLYLLVVKLMS
jgi:patched 1 protein